MTIMLMTVIIVLILGLVLGSFSGAQVWRLRARQLTQDKEVGEDYDTAEYDRLVGLSKQKTTEDRSRCLSCGHTLAWYDLVPLVSWFSTKGKCRYCKQPIGRFEPLIEVGTAAVFTVFAYLWLSSFGTSLIGLGLLALWLAAFTMLIILFVYDLKWFLLPDVVVFPLIGLSVVITASMIAVMRGTDLAVTLLSIVASVGILSGLYFILWLVSRGMWVGFGDVKLGIALGILLIDWKLALLTLFLANLIGTFIVLPGLLTKKLSRKTQVPFGPLLIAGFFISLFSGSAILQSYDTFSIWLSSVLLML